MRRPRDSRVRASRPKRAVLTAISRNAHGRVTTPGGPPRDPADRRRLLPASRRVRTRGWRRSHLHQPAGTAACASNRPSGRVHRHHRPDPETVAEAGVRDGLVNVRDDAHDDRRPRERARAACCWTSRRCSPGSRRSTAPTATTTWPRARSTSRRESARTATRTAARCSWPSSASLNIFDGRLQLGRWQRIFLVELDGPRSRELSVLVLGQSAH
jgi:hypothetical protein